MLFQVQPKMGNADSSQEREEIGDKIFLYAKSFLQDKVEDDSELEEITGIILHSSSDLNEFRSLLKDNTKELERRINKSRLFLKGKREKSGFEAKCEMQERRQELINHFERLNPNLDSAQIADELLNLPEKELDNVISTPVNLKEFLKSCTNKTRDLIVPKSQVEASASNLDNVKLRDKLKIDQKKPDISSELSKADVDTLIANQLFQRVNELHPSKAEVITGVLLELQKDVVLHLVASAPLLHKNIAVVIGELEKQKRLSPRDVIALQEELGDVIYTLLEEDMDSDKASHVTGMLLEMNIAEVHEVLADEKLLHNRVKKALGTLQKR